MKRICIIASLALVSLCAMANPVDIDTVPIAPLKTPVYTQRLDSVILDAAKLIIHYGNNGYDNVQEWFSQNGLGKWVKTEEHTFTYNLYNQQIEELTKKFTGENVTEQYQIKSYYDAQGNVVKQNFFNLDLESNEWSYNKKIISSYNAVSKITESVVNMYDENNIWYVKEKTTYTYDTKGRLINRSNYGLGTNLNTYTTYEYNATGTSFTQKEFGPFGFNGQFIVNFDIDGNSNSIYTYFGENIDDTPISHSYSTYNHDVLASSVLNANSNPNAVNRIDKTDHYSYNDAKEPMLSATTLLYYSDFKKTPATNILAETVVLYPNPASQFIKLSTAGTIEIFTAGRSLFAGSVASGESINVSAWPQGMYLYQISTAEGSVSGTFVKE